MMAVSKTNSIYRDQNISYKCFVFIYKVFHVVLGLNFGFIQFNNINSKVTSVILLFTQTTTFCSIRVWYLWQTGPPTEVIVWTTLQLILYVICVLSLACTKKELTFYSLYHDLQIIDLGLEINHASYYLEIKLLLFIFAFLLSRLIVVMAYCIGFNLCKGFDLNAIVYFALRFSLDVIPLNCAFIFYGIRCRLKQLVSLVKSENSNFLAIHHLYKSIVDIAEQHIDAIVPMFIATLMFTIPLVMGTIYFSVLEIRKDEVSYMTVFAQYATAFQIILTTLLPALCAGMLSTQAEKIKIILHNKLMQPQELAQAARIGRFIRYVEARGCRWRVFARLPLDARLLAAVLSFCATYLIVIIQFTYNYKLSLT